MLTRLWLAGPLLYIGLLMAMDPDSFFSMLRKTDKGMRRLAHRLCGLYWDGALPALRPASSGERREARCLGGGLAAFSFMYLAGFFR